MGDSLTLHKLIGGNQTLIPGPAPYVRPSDWLTLPTVSTGDIKFVGLIAIRDNGSNFCALTAAGDYAVDWGDGVVENILSGVQANHNYDYNDVDLDPTVCSRGYKMAIVTVTPQPAQSFTTINLNVKHTQATLQKYEAGWLDIAISGADLTTIRIGGALGSPTPVNFLAMLEIVKIVDKNAAITSFSSLFSLCRSLQSIDVNCSGITNFAFMFTDCNSLVSIPLIDTSSGTTLQSMFTSCYSLRSIPLLDTSSCTTFQSMFNSCGLLRTIPLINTGNSSNFSGMFISCVELRTLPPLDLSSATQVDQMFSSCVSLQTVPLFNTSSVGLFNSMFASCSSLQTVPLFDMTSATSTQSMFINCISLREVPFFDTSNLSQAQSMFQNCRALKEIPAFNFGNCTNLSSIFSGCTALAEIPLINTSNATNCNTMFSQCFNLKKIALIDLSKNVDFSSMFNTCSSLQEIPLFIVNLGNNFGTIFSSCSGLRQAALSGSTRTISFATLGLSQTKLVEIFNNLGVAFNARVGKSYTSAGAGPWTVTVTSVAHGLVNGNSIVVFNATSANANGTFTITRLDNDTFTYSEAVGNPGVGTLSYRFGTALVVTVTSNWGTAGLTAPEKLICTNKGYTLTT